MYQKPDFVQVSVKVADVFANYLATGCPEDERLMWQFTVPCEGTDKYQQVSGTLTSMGLGHECYTSFNP